MAEAAITSVLSKLGELAVSEVKILIQVGDDMMLLRDRLEWLQAFVRDADRKRRAGTDGLTGVWVRQTRDVAFDAEDAIDDFFHDEVTLKKHGFRGWKTWARHFTGHFSRIVVRHGLSSRIASIKSRLDQISANQKEYNLEHTPSVALSSSTTAIAAWRDDHDQSVGLDEDVGILMRMMLPGEHRMFISIVGESGAGKASLMGVLGAAIPDDNVVKVRLSKPAGMSDKVFLWNLYKVALIKCRENVPGEEEGVANSVGDKLRVFLASRRYALFLGGITSISTFNYLRASLPDPDGGSCVVLGLDTENEEVAWHANTMNREGISGVHFMTRLDKASCEKLFFWKVLRKEERRKSPKDEEYSRLVHDITGGNPMAIVLVAGLLRFKEKPFQWDAMLQRLQISSGFSGSSSSSKQEEEEEQLMSSVRQRQLLCCTRRALEIIFWECFEDLSNDLKSCFLYFANSIDNASEYADKIVRMWIGEGFIKPRHGKTPEEVGHEYLKELVLRCLVELKGTKPDGGIKYVSVHRSLRVFLRSEVAEAGFMEIHDVSDAPIPPSARRLCVHIEQGKWNTPTNHKLPKLRSFICSSIMQQEQLHKDQHDLKFLCGSKFIRVISVSGLMLHDLPDQMCNMIQLRYLDVDCKHLRQLPSSIAKLLNLQTLDITGTSVEEIDKNFWKIKTLRHVLADNLQLPVSDSAVELDGSQLLTLHGVRPIACQKWSAETCPLRKMTNMRSLKMHGFQLADHAFEAALGNMPLLGHLGLEGDEIPSCVFTDPSLQRLQTMELHGSAKWNDIINQLPKVTRPLRMVRPNLVQLNLRGQISWVMPHSITKQLEGILIP